MFKLVQSVPQWKQALIQGSNCRVILPNFFVFGISNQ